MGSTLDEPSGYAPTGYQMIDEVRITNFRRFALAELKSCRRINVIIGDNGMGKTALLEALFLAAGRTPEIATRVRGWRGLEGAFHGSVRQIEDAIWRD